MSKDLIPLMAPDISRFARQMGQQLRDAPGPPSHLSLINMLARAAGFRNYQHMRAAAAAQARLTSAPVTETTDFRLVERTLQHFDPQGQLVRWPSRRPVQELCLWTLWADLPADRKLHEREVNAVLNRAHLFGDAALLRRSLFGLGLVRRNRDGSDYRRQEKRPPAEAREVIRHVQARRTAPPGRLSA